ncbi:MAG: hypothetical protein Ta2B_06920 [Termitinemataceae bacterium]|nr:MAG: hypothetical protein Ta2B_06920 [Termitinemataceae bacterium]
MNKEIDFMPDVFFYGAQQVNFREVHTTGIAHGRLYRCSHPVVGNRQDPDIAQLACSAKIASIINLCDKEEKLGGIAAMAPWYRKIYNKNNAIALDMLFDFRQGEFTEKLKRGLQFMVLSPAPFFVHCYAGFDRTGIFCAILEALMGATKKEIGDEYSFSYNSDCDSEFYEYERKDHGHIILEQLENLFEKTFTDDDLQKTTQQNLIEKVGLTPNEIDAIEQKLSDTCGLS